MLRIFSRIEMQRYQTEQPQVHLWNVSHWLDALQSVEHRHNLLNEALKYLSKVLIMFNGSIRRCSRWRLQQEGTSDSANRVDELLPSLMRHCLQILPQVLRELVRIIHHEDIGWPVLVNPAFQYMFASSDLLVAEKSCIYISAFISNQKVLLSQTLHNHINDCITCPRLLQVLQARQQFQDDDV